VAPPRADAADAEPIEEGRVSLERLLNARELAELLGFQPGTIVDWSERGELPGFRLGGRLRFRESEVADWLESRRLDATPSSLYSPRVS